MNKILKLILSNNPDDQEIAKELIKDSTEIKEHLNNIATYLGPRNKVGTHKIFSDLMYPRDLYHSIAEVLGTKYGYIRQKYWEDTRWAGVLRMQEGPGFEEAKESLEILLNDE